MVSIKTKLPHQLACIHCVISKSVRTILTEITQLCVPVLGPCLHCLHASCVQIAASENDGESFDIVRGCLSRTTRGTTN